MIFGIAGAAMMVDRASYSTDVALAPPQPVPFSHQHHVAGLGLQCLYCHTSVEKSSFAGIPPTSTCVNCHSQIWSETQMLAPVRASYETGKPIEWSRVHKLAQYVYFYHNIHVNKGIGCATCHGRVDQMQLTRKDQPMNMQWCINCHMNPEKYIRPRDKIYDMAYQLPAVEQQELGRKLVAEYKVKKPGQLITCAVCHH
ncbi:MAG: cytochrome c3 family protein [Pyrinomonadaceae bacterium]